jgi:carbamate kinase
VICQTVVDAEDPAFLRPSRFVWRACSERRAACRRTARERSFRQQDRPRWSIVLGPCLAHFLDLPTGATTVEAGHAVDAVHFPDGSTGPKVVRDEHEP